MLSYTIVNLLIRVVKRQRAVVLIPKLKNEVDVAKAEWFQLHKSLTNFS